MTQQNLTVAIQNRVSSDVRSLTVEQVGHIDFAINKTWTMPEFKAKHFVGNAQVTPYAEIKQYYVELASREDLVESLEYDAKKAQFELEREEDSLSKLTDPIDIKLQALEVEKLQRVVKKKLNHLYSAYRERDLYVSLIDKFNEGPSGRLPDGRLLSEAMRTDNELIEKLEKEYWTLRLAKQTAMDMIAYGRAGVGNMDAVAMLGKEQQEEVMAIACDYFVRNEVRTNSLLSMANERFQLGAPAGKLAQQLELDIQGKPDDAHLIQSGQ
jgi:hypothetical protein